MNKYLLLILFAAVLPRMHCLNNTNFGWVGNHRTMVNEFARTNPEGFRQLVEETERNRIRLF